MCGWGWGYASACESPSCGWCTWRAPRSRPMYGADVLGGVSLGALAALVPLGVGLHGVVLYGRRVDRRIAAADEADDRRWA